MVNSIRKGRNGEREFARFCREQGYDCRRGQQGGQGMNRDKNGRFIGKEQKLIVFDGNCYCIKDGHLLFIVDEGNYSIVKNTSWSKMPSGYIFCNKSKKLLHRIIAGAVKGQMVDHINRQKWDNRENNLRLCNKSQNAYNSKLNTNNKSGVKGVYYRKDTRKWSAEIKHNYKKISLGCFDTKEEAAKARAEASVNYCKKFVGVLADG